MHTQGKSSGSEAARPIAEVLAERGSRYGDFATHAEVTQDLQNVLARHLQQRGKTLAPYQAEALEMICHKIGRIINGDPNYDDSWVDIAGYAQLVVDELRKGASASRPAAWVPKMFERVRVAAKGPGEWLVVAVPDDSSPKYLLEAIEGMRVRCRFDVHEMESA